MHRTTSNSGHIVLFLAILAWYISSTALVSTNKILLDVLQVHIPLFSTFVHFCLISTLVAILKWKNPDLLGVLAITHGEFLRIIVPVAILTALDVGLTNMAYSRIPVMVMTVLKSSAPVCIYTAAVLFRLEHFSYVTCALCVVIAGSVSMAVPVAPDDGVSPDVVAGVLMISFAVISLSIRWVLVQTLLERYSPLQVLYLVQPTSALFLLPFAIGFEINSSLFEKLSSSSPWLPLGLLGASSLAALLLLLSEYKIVHETSSLTLSIAGIGKEVLILCLSLVVFGETFSLRQIIATCVSILGIIVYVVVRSRSSGPESRISSGYIQQEEEDKEDKELEGPPSPLRLRHSSSSPRSE